jgi:hypothetical protein
MGYTVPKRCILTVNKGAQTGEEDSFTANFAGISVYALF